MDGQMDGFQQSAVILPVKLKHLASGNLDHCDIHDKMWTVSSTSCKQRLAAMRQSLTLKLIIRTNFSILLSCSNLGVNSKMEKSHKSEILHFKYPYLSAVDKVKINFNLKMFFRFCKYHTMHISYGTCHIKSWDFNIHVIPYFYVPVVLPWRQIE